MKPGVPTQMAVVSVAFCCMMPKSISWHRTSRQKGHGESGITNSHYAAAWFLPGHPSSQASIPRDPTSRRLTIGAHLQHEAIGAHVGAEEHVGRLEVAVQKSHAPEGLDGRHELHEGRLQPRRPELEERGVVAGVYGSQSAKPTRRRTASESGVRTAWREVHDWMTASGWSAAGCKPKTHVIVMLNHRGYVQAS